MFDSLKNIGQLTQLMGKAQKLQDAMKKMQESLSMQRMSADAGDGRVTATVNGRMELLDLRIDRERMDATNVNLLQDLIVAAVQGAQAKAAEVVKQEMQRLSADVGLPPEMLPQLS